jgi:hypothetical protein
MRFVSSCVAVSLIVATSALAGCTKREKPADKQEAETAEPARAKPEAESKAKPAEAASKPATWLDGKFDRYLVSPRGEVIGMLLTNGTVVQVPERAFSSGVPDLHAGDAVRVRGKVVPQGGAATVVKHARIEQNGAVIADVAEARKAKKEKAKGEKVALAPMEASGKILAVFANAKGKGGAIVLADGTTALARQDLTSLNLKVGDSVSVKGRGASFARGKGMWIESVTLPGGETKVLAKGGGKKRERRRG